MRRSTLLGMAMITGLGLDLSGCGGNDPTGTKRAGSETHFMLGCLEGCGNLDCHCGVCTRGCKKDADCNRFPGAKCLEPSSVAVCSSDAPERICDVECSDDVDCDVVGSDAACVAGRCRSVGSASTAMSILQAAAVEAPECSAMPDPSGQFLPFGTLDVAFASRYQPLLLVTSELPDSELITLRQFSVELLNAQGGAINSFEAATAGTVGEGRMVLAAATLIPPAVADDLANSLNPGESTTIVANARVFGDTAAGAVVGSQVFTFPIDVCFGCLVEFLPEVDDPAQPGFQCSLGSSSQPDEVEPPCLLGQDERIDCRTCCSAFIGVEPFNTMCGCR